MNAIIMSRRAALTGVASTAAVFAGAGVESADY
jgi:hypothetical protein